MPSNYTGDPTAALSPSPTPGPGSIPIVTLPSDGDADNAASVAQALKVPANEIAWLKAPFALAGAGNWGQRIVAYENARRQSRFGVDHMGYPDGYINAWEENFDRFASGSAFPTSPPVGEPWQAIVGVGNVTARVPGGVPAGSLWPRIELAPASPANDTSAIWRIGSCRANTSDLGLSMRWKACLSAIGTNGTTIVMGLTDAASSLGADPPGYGVHFRKTDSDTTWQCFFKTDAGTLSSIDSGFSMGVNIWQDFRIEILGANISDDSAGAVRFYINDLLAATLAVDVSSIAATNINPISPFFMAKTTAFVANMKAWIAAVKYRHNTAV